MFYQFQVSSGRSDTLLPNLKIPPNHAFLFLYRVCFVLFSSVVFTHFPCHFKILLCWSSSFCSVELKSKEQCWIGMLSSKMSRYRTKYQDQMLQMSKWGLFCSPTATKSLGFAVTSFNFLLEDLCFAQNVKEWVLCERQWYGTMEWLTKEVEVLHLQTSLQLVWYNLSVETKTTKSEPKPGKKLS